MDTSDHFSKSSSYFSYYLADDLITPLRRGYQTPIELALLVVDSEDTKGYFTRLRNACFRVVSCTNNTDVAINLLEDNIYDVILTEINRIEGGINGIEFAKESSKIQTQKGIKPKIYVFSSDCKALWEIPYSEREIFTDIIHKIDFTAYKFRTLVTKGYSE